MCHMPESFHSHPQCVGPLGISSSLHAPSDESGVDSFTLCQDQGPVGEPLDELMELSYRINMK